MAPTKDMTVFKSRTNYLIIIIRNLGPIYYTNKLNKLDILMPQLVVELRNRRNYFLM